MLNYAHTVGTTLYDSSSRTVILELRKGPRVGVRVSVEEPPQGGSGRVHGNGLSTFSGHENVIKSCNMSVFVKRL